MFSQNMDLPQTASLPESLADPSLLPFTLCTKCRTCYFHSRLLVGRFLEPLSGPLRCSVVVPTYNRLSVLPRAIESVLTQDETDFELIVVDDSTDDTPAWLASLTDPRIRVIRPERRGGVGAARNVGIAAARAPIVAFLDSDDWFLPHRLRRSLDPLDREPDLVCTLVSATKEVRGEMRPSPLTDVKLGTQAFEWALYSDLIGVDGSSITVRTEAARAIGGFYQKSRSEDREFLIRLAPHGAARLIPDILWAKGWSENSLSNEWKGAGRDLLAYAEQRPELTTRFRKLGSYLASKILVYDLRRGDFATLAADWRAFRDAGLLPGNLARIWREHREVRKYRRANSNREALMRLSGAPADWT
ncbi:MAG TPA: glycosyltransferase [Pseudolabrys sp.]|jgi:glycosyltransferase involved in cell wall biosynthesis